MKFDFSDPISKYTLTIEDNGSVAYAYLLDGDEIVSDVWLYNHGLPSDRADWNNPKGGPFKNVFPYIAHGIFKPLTDATEMRVEWLHEGDSCIGVKLFVRGELFAFLKPGERPGQSKLIEKDGPLGKVLVPNQV